MTQVLVVILEGNKLQNRREIEFSFAVGFVVA
jgi:hypothetical protein